MGSSDNGGGEVEFEVDVELGGKIPLKSSSVDDYRLLQEELELAWARLTDDERTHLDDEAKRRRRANPFWPHVTSDHVDRLAEKLDKNTRAVDRLDRALTDPERGLNFKVRQLIQGVAVLTTSVSVLTTSNDILRDAVVMLNGNVERLCLALEGRPA